MVLKILGPLLFYLTGNVFCSGYEVECRADKDARNTLNRIITQHSNVDLELSAAVGLHQDWGLPRRSIFNGRMAS